MTLGREIPSLEKKSEIMEVPSNPLNHYENEGGMA